MSRSAEQKVKLLVLYDILQKLTDEDHPLSTDELIALLSAKGISVERKALLRDIDTLNEWGFEVLSFKKKCYYFYVAYRRFDVAELRILIDAVQSASFISEKRTIEFTEKIAELAGENKGEALKKGLVCYDTNKHNNSHVFYGIDILENAIESKKQVSFLYFDYDLDKNKVYRKDKARYVVNPLSLIFTRDNYYLVCYNDKYKNLSNYRIDRMESLQIEDKDITLNKTYENFNIHKHKIEVFSMYVGEPCVVELEADNDMVDEIIDRFGEKIRISYRGETFFRISVTVQLSPPFFSWITVFKGKIRIKSPQKAKDQMTEYISHSYIV